jgi:hypothetical protein
VPSSDAERLSGMVALGVIACVLAALASITRPFTLGADLVTGAGIVCFLALQVFLLLRERRERATSGRGSLLDEGLCTEASKVRFRVYVPWIVLSASVVAFELIEYFSEPRHDHPTLSVLSDDLTRWHAGHAVLFVAWLGLGWLLLTRPGGARRDVAGSL